MKIIHHGKTVVKYNRRKNAKGVVSGYFATL